MASYKAVKDFVAHYIERDEIIPHHVNDYIVIKEVDNIDVIKVMPSEEIPDEFFIEEQIE